MNISPDSLITVNQILADVLLEAGDEDYRIFTPGWYTSQIQQALEELGFDTLMEIQHDDFDFPSATYAINMPANTFNLREIYVYNGAKGEPTDSQPVRWKKNYFTRGASKGMFARHTADTDQDPYIINTISEGTQDQLLFASVENGVIRFSSKCASYSFVHLIYNGTFTPIGDTPFVPPIFRQAVKKWVMVEFYRVMRNRDRSYVAHFRDSYDELTKPFTGVWSQAVRRAKKMDSKTRDDLKEYLSKMNSNAM